MSQQIMKYEEPAFLPDSINYYPLNQEEITDFSSLDGNLNGYDYKLTHSNKDMLEEEMKNVWEVRQIMTEEEFDEAAGKKDACYHKVKSRYKVWPSAYASGALVQCRKKGAANWGNSKKKKKKK